MMLQEKLYQYANDPECPDANYMLAKEYHKLNQYAAAVSFYIRATEMATDMEMIYNSLVLAAICFDSQKRRNFTVEGLLQYAISIFPTRPEAHFHLCRLYEQTKEWRKLLTHAELGLVEVENNKQNDELEYPGLIAFKFYKALSHYQSGVFEKGKKGFMDIVYFNPKNNIYSTIAKNNLRNLGYPDVISYESGLMQSRYKFRFPGFEKIKKNHSKHFQDMFVLSILNGKRSGYYIEFGAGYPFFTNNTALLETEFDWKGLSYEIKDIMCYDFAEKRKNPILLKDALETDIKQDFTEHCVPAFVDYLQIDCDKASLSVLERIPFDSYQFGIIQYEHDLYQCSVEEKMRSEEILKSKGYIRLVNNVAFNEKDAYEDWWVHPNLYKKEFEGHPDINFILDYMLDFE